MMRRVALGLVLLAAFPLASAGVPVQIPGILITDEQSDPFRYEDGRGAILGYRYLSGALTVASSALGLADPVACVVRPDRKLYVLDRSADPFDLGQASGAVFLVDPAAPPRDAIASTVLASPLFRRPSDLLLDQDGRILVIDSDADPFGRGDAPGALFRGDPVTFNFEALASDPAFREPVGLTADRDGTYLILDRAANPLGLNDFSPGALFRYDPVTAEVALVKAFDPNQLPDPRAVAVLPNGDYLVVDADADPTGFSDDDGAIFRIARSTGQVTAFIDDPIFREPLDLVLGEENQLWVLDAEADPDGSISSVGALFRFDVPTRLRTLTQSSTLFQTLASLSFAGGASLDGSTVTWTDETGGRVEPGNLITVRAELTSIGVSDAVGAVYTDTLDTEWEFVAGSDSLGAGEFDFDPETRVLAWTVDVPSGETETLRYRMRVSGVLREGDIVRDTPVVRVGTVPIFYEYEAELAEPFAPGTIVFVDQSRLQGEDVGLILAIDPSRLSPQTVWVGDPLVEPVDAVFLEDGRLAVLDLRAVPEQGTGAQAVLLYDNSGDTFEVLWSREPGDGIVAPSGLAVDRDGDLLLIDRNANPFDLPYEPDIANGDFGPGAVYRIDRESGALQPWFSDERMREPVDAEVDRNGIVVVVDFTGMTGVGDLWEYDRDSDTVLRRFLNSNWFRDPLGLALDPVSGTAYVADRTHFNDENENPVVNNGTLLQVTRGNPSTYAILSQSSLLVDPSDCFLAEDGLLYIADREANPLRLNTGDPGAVFRFDRSTGQLTTVAADFGVRKPDGPTGLSSAGLEVSELTLLDLDGGAIVAGDTLQFTLEVTNPARQRLREVVLDMTLSATLEVESGEADFGDVLEAPGIGKVSWIGEISAGETLHFRALATVRDGFGFAAPVRATARVGAQSQSVTREVEDVLASSFPPGTILLADESSDLGGPGTSSGALFSLDPSDGSVSVVLDARTLRDPSAVLFRPDGKLYIADRLAGLPGDVLLLDPVTGSITSATGSDTRLQTPVDLLFTPTGSLLIVDKDADVDPIGEGRGTIFRVTGSQPTAIFSAAREFRSISQAAYLADGRLFVADRQADPDGVGGNSAALFELNPATGAVIESWQFPLIREPSGLAAWQDTLLLITDYIANPRGFQGTTGALFTFDPDTGALSEFLATPLLVGPYRSFPQITGRVLIVDQAARAGGQTGNGLVFDYDPATRLVQTFAASDSFLVPAHIAQLPTALIEFAAFEAADSDDAPLYPADRVSFRAELGNGGAIAGEAEYRDPLDTGVVLIPGTLGASSGTIREEDGGVVWTGSVGAGQVVELTYQAQLDPVRARDRVLRFQPSVVAPIVGEITRTQPLAVFVPLEPGHLYVMDSDADPLGTQRAPGAILKVQQRTGSTTAWHSDPNWRFPVDLAVAGDTDPRVYVLDQTARVDGGGRGLIWEIDPADLATRVAAADPTWLRTESMLSTSGSELFVVDSWADPLGLDAPVGPGAIYRVDAETGESMVIASDTSWVRPVDFARTPGGRWLLLDADADPLRTGSARGALFSIDPSTGRSEFFAASRSWVEPVALAVDADSVIYVLDQQATPLGTGRGSVWTLKDAPGAEPELFAVSDALVRLYDVTTQIDGDVILVDGEASPGLQVLGRGALFVTRGGGVLPLAATTAMIEPRRVFVYGDVTPIVELGLFLRLRETGIEVGWRGLSDRSDTRYLIYRRVLEGPELEGEPNLLDYELVPTSATFQGPGDHLFLDDGVAAGTWYAYVVAVVAPDGVVDTSRPAVIQTGPGVLRFALSPGEPNPFREGTALRLQVPRKGRVDLDLFDVGGRRVRSLVDGELDPGVHIVVWDGRSERGHAVPSGVYFARASWDGQERSERLVRIR